MSNDVVNSLVADIAVNVPLRHPFRYLIPAELEEQVKVGCRVSVDFGSRTVNGIVVNVQRGQAKNLKIIKEVLDGQPLLTGALLKLLRWAAEYYCHPLGQVLSSALPADLGSNRSKTRIVTEPYYSVVDPDIRVMGALQQKILSFLLQNGSAGLSDIREKFPSPYAPLKRLVERGSLGVTTREVNRDPFAQVKLQDDTSLTLNDDQENAVDEVSDFIGLKTFKGFLLHGVTGSGKTEVYLKTVETCLTEHMRALVLVPEISLTPQLVARFRARFEPADKQIAVLHSGLSAGERYDSWRRILRHQVDIVIGARSAVFAPLENIGLIIVDEEHDTSYKQGEGFRYNGRDLALVRAKHENCPIILGSATPSLASYYRSEHGGLKRLELDQRAHAGDLPRVQIVDLKEQRSDGELSNFLIGAIQESLELKEQVLLLLNRRGFAPFLLCTDCGVSFHCPNCEITLTYHQAADHLRCHYCGYVEPVPKVCDKCQGLNIVTQGVGTEQLELELEKLFPGARVARMDRDTTGRKGAHQKIMERMLDRDIDILVGTQMIAKGHDFPGVALVGVLGADSILNFPDFRSAGRSFSLFTQVAGRAGRTGGGRVFIQSYHADHYALTCAADHAYREFYEHELPFRQELGYPPCGHLVNLIFSGNNMLQVRSTAQRFAGDLRPMSSEVEILGPSPCPLARLRGKHRYQILLKATRRPPLRCCLDHLEELRKKNPRQVQLHVDVDPLDML